MTESSRPTLDSLYPYFAVPESVGPPDEFRYPPNTANQLLAFQRQVGTIVDADDEPHIVYVGYDTVPPSTVAHPARLIYN